MPELPEVETIKRGLQKSIIGLKIKDIQINITELNKKISARHPAGVIPDCWLKCEFRFLEEYCKIQRATGLLSGRLAKLLVCDQSINEDKKIKGEKEKS